jgi:hypothetical protein
MQTKVGVGGTAVMAKEEEEKEENKGVVKVAASSGAPGAHYLMGKVEGSSGARGVRCWAVKERSSGGRGVRCSRGRGKAEAESSGRCRSHPYGLHDRWLEAKAKVEGSSGAQGAHSLTGRVEESSGDQGAHCLVAKVEGSSGDQGARCLVAILVVTISGDQEERCWSKGKGVGSGVGKARRPNNGALSNPDGHCKMAGVAISGGQGGHCWRAKGVTSGDLGDRCWRVKGANSGALGGHCLRAREGGSGVVKEGTSGVIPTAMVAISGEQMRWRMVEGLKGGWGSWNAATAADSVRKCTSTSWMAASTAMRAGVRRGMLARQRKRRRAQRREDSHGG